MKATVYAIAVAVLIAPTPTARSVVVEPAELAKAKNWVVAHFPTPNETTPGEPPFSFIYNGQASAELVKGWQVNRSARQLDARRTEHTVTYTDPNTRLLLRCDMVQYHDFPTVEWTLF